MIDAFLQWKELNQGRSAGTINSYRAKLLQLEAWLAQQGSSFAAANPELLARFVGLELHRRGVKPRSRRTWVACVRQFFAHAYSTGALRQNPAAGLEYPSMAAALPHDAKRGDVEALFIQTDLSAFQGVRDAAIIAVLAGCGLRVSGIVGLNESDIAHYVDGDARQEIAVLRVREKGGHERHLPLPDDAYLLIRAYLGHPELDRINRLLPNGDRVLFVNTRNHVVPPDKYFGEATRLSRNGVRRMLVKYGTRAGIPRERLHPHAFRHLFGVELAEGGVDLDLRAALLGHRSLESTRIYDRMSMRRMRKVVEKFGPLASIRTPVSDLRHLLKDASSRPRTGQN